MSELSVHSFFAFAHHHFPSKALMAQSISDLIFLHLNQLDNCFYMNEFEMFFLILNFMILLLLLILILILESNDSYVGHSIKKMRDIPVAFRAWIQYIT